MFATDPLSLVFLGCILFSLLFLVIASVSGIGHGAHLGTHIGAHGGHLGAPLHSAHLGPAATSHSISPPTHATAHAAHPQPATTSAHADAAGAQPALQGFVAALLGAVNLFGVLSFLLLFGVLGYAFHNLTPLGVAVSLVVPALVGVGGAVAAGLFLDRLFPETVLDPSSSQLIGRRATVSLAIRPGGVGEILFTDAGAGRQSVGARSTDGEGIATGEEVLILDYSDGIASVQPWDRLAASLRHVDAARSEMPATSPSENTPEP